MESTTKHPNNDQLPGATERHVYKESNFLKFLEWTTILRNASGGERVCHFGCGDGSLLELEYRNRAGTASYIGLDSDSALIEANKTKWQQLDWAQFITADLASGGNDYSAFLNIEADTVVAFNVPKTLRKIPMYHYIQNLYMCGNLDARYYLRLPKATDHVAEGDLIHFINQYFIVVNRFGLHGSIEDFKPLMNDWQREMCEGLLQYYSPEIVSGFMSPFFPDQCQQTLWVLKRKLTI
ncbi:MAG: hypothetical protein A3F72_03600 [Bacteroidetes bacterium RIFCSPLOWO2_12_FULL_35_15]|nr:MAG: hypothetical protein A3F72_03600 [Bacteroidetes bacterium RIFCSPLOWO2_12_FULL_35_15]